MSWAIIFEHKHRLLFKNWVETASSSRHKQQASGKGLHPVGPGWSFTWCCPTNMMVSSNLITLKKGHQAVQSQLAFSCSNFSGSMKGLSMDLIISSPQYTHSDAMMSSMSDLICSRLVPALPFPKLTVSPSSLGVGRWRDLVVCAVAASFFCRSSRRVCLKVVRWGVTS